MKFSTLGKLIGLSALTVAFSTSAFAAVDADAASALVKKSGCLKCHAIDKDKKGPSLKKIAAKFKGKADAESQIVTTLTKSPKVKMADGSEEEHKAIDSKDAAEIKNVAGWILTQ